MQGRGAPRLPRTGPTTPALLFPWEPGIDSFYFIYASPGEFGASGKARPAGPFLPLPPPPESPSRAQGARAKSEGVRGEGSGRESAVSMATALASKDARALLSLRPGPAPDRPSLGPLLGAQRGNGRSSRASQLPPPPPTFATPTRRPRAAAAKKRSASLRRSCGALLRPPEEQSEALPPTFESWGRGGNRPDSFNLLRVLQPPVPGSPLWLLPALFLESQCIFLYCGD